MAVKPDLAAISDALEESGFKSQLGRDMDLYEVRRSPDPRLWERIEFILLGPAKTTLVLAVGVAAVSEVSLQHRGLVVRGGLQELCTDPENGRVEFEVPQEFEAWLSRLSRLGPLRTAEFTAGQGPALLERTHEAREAAARAWSVGSSSLGKAPRVAIEELSSQMAEPQARAYGRLCGMPFISAPAYEDEHRAALAALVRTGDDELLALGGVRPTKLAPPEMRRLQRMFDVPQTAVWRVKLLVDRMLQERQA